jgi:hypothetical protein
MKNFHLLPVRTSQTVRPVKTSLFRAPICSSPPHCRFPKRFFLSACCSAYRQRYSPRPPMSPIRH